MDSTRFNITYTPQGVQKTNPYILQIANGINEYWRRRGTPLDFPTHTYGMIHRDKPLLELWEKRLKKEGILK